MDRERVKGALRGVWKRAATIEVLASVFALWVAYRVLLRSRYGVDITDEAFYAVLHHRFALGDKPYLDEVNLRQTFSLVTLPIYWVRLKLTHSTDGIIHFLRMVYFIITCGTALTIYRFARDRVGHGLAVLIGLLGIAFVPFHVPTCSYNTLGCTFLTAGIFLSLWRLSGPAPRWTHFLSGFAHGLAMIAYPPLAIAIVVFAVATPFLDDGDRKWRNAALYVVGGVASVVMILPHLSAAGISGIKEAVVYEKSLTAPRTIEKFWAVLNDLWNVAPTQPRLVAVTLLFIVAARSFGIVRVLLLPCLIPAIAWWVNTPPIRGGGLQHVVGLYFNVYAGLAGLAILALRRVDRESLRFFFCCFVPSAIAGVTNGYSSDNGALNAGLGAFPAAVLALVLATEIASNHGKRQRAVWWTAAAAASVVYYHVELIYSFVYRDAPVEALTARVRTGPYKGMYTTPATSALLAELTSVLRRHEDKAGRIVSYYDFPAGYLFTQMRVGMPSSWTDARIAPSPFMMDYYKRHLTGHGLVVRWPVANRFGRTELDALVEDPTRVLYKSPNGWTLYREPPPSK
ncbi:MAG: hypothetical protein ACXVEF_44265 [Polyangiales bacterium]